MLLSRKRQMSSECAYVHLNNVIMKERVTIVANTAIRRCTPLNGLISWIRRLIRVLHDHMCMTHTSPDDMSWVGLLVQLDETPREDLRGSSCLSWTVAVVSKSGIFDCKLSCYSILTNSVYVSSCAKVFGDENKKTQSGLLMKLGQVANNVSTSI